MIGELKIDLVSYLRLYELGFYVFNRDFYPSFSIFVRLRKMFVDFYLFLFQNIEIPDP